MTHVSFFMQVSECKSKFIVVFLFLIRMDRESMPSRGGLREQKKRESRRCIIRAAEDLFIEKGVEQTTVADIIERTGLARGTFYNYFQRKEEIWRYLLMKVLQKSNEMATGIADKTSNREEFVYRSLLSFLKVVMTNKTTTALIVRNQGALRVALFTGNDAFTITGILEQNFRASGYFDQLSEREMKLFIFSVIGASLEIVVQSFLQEIPATPESLATFLTSLFLNGVRQ